MFRANRIDLPSVRPTHLVTALLAGFLLLSIEGVVPQPVEAGSTKSQMAATRRSQHRAEATMHRADKRLKSLERAKTRSRKRAAAAAKRLKHMRRRRGRVEKRLSAAVARLDDARMDRDRKLRVHPNPSGSQIVDRPRLRKRVRQLDHKADTIERKVKRLQRKAKRTRTIKRKRARGVHRAKRRIERKIQQHVALGFGIHFCLGASLARMEARVALEETLRLVELPVTNRRSR